VRGLNGSLLLLGLISDSWSWARLVDCGLLKRAGEVCVLRIVSALWVGVVRWRWVLTAGVSSSHNALSVITYWRLALPEWVEQMCIKIE